MWEEGQTFVAGAALQRPMDVKASPSWFKEPISEAVRPFVEGVWPSDGFDIFSLFYSFFLWGCRGGSS